MAPNFRHTEVEWNHARCNRLLRPLRTHLAVLEKHCQRKVGLEAAEDRISQSKRCSKTASQVQRESKVLLTPDEPAWLSGSLKETKTRRKRQYSARSSSGVTANLQGARASITSSVPGEIPMPSPFVTRISEEDRRSKSSAPIKPGLVKSFFKKAVKSFQVRGFNEPEVLRAIKTAYLSIITATASKTPHADIYDILHELRDQNEEARKPFQDFNVYSYDSGELKGISSCLVSHRKGAPSLRSMAIRAMPSYIECHEQIQQTYNKEDRIDITDFVYQQMDTINLLDDEGEHISSSIVRAHATKLLADAVRAGYIPRRTFLGITEQLKAMWNATREVDMLVKAWTAAQIPDKRYNNCLRNMMFSDILIYPQLVDADLMNRQHARAFNSILENPYVPVEWMATRSFTAFWKPIILSIAENDIEFAEGQRFLETLIARGCSLDENPKEAMETLVQVPAIDNSSTQPITNCYSCAPGHPEDEKHADLVNAAFTNSLYSMFTMLTSLVVVGASEFENNFSPDLPKLKILLQSLAFNMIEHLRDPPEHSFIWMEDVNRKVLYAVRCIPVLASALLVTLFCPDTPSSHVDYPVANLIKVMSILEQWMQLSTGRRPAGVFDRLPGLLIQVACASHRMCDAIEPVSVLRALIEALLSPAAEYTDLARPECRQFLQQICMSATVAFYEREHGADGDAAVFLAFVEDLVNGDPESLLPLSPPRVPGASTPVRSSQVNIPGISDVGYRWEEGLAEWVVATPAVREKWRGAESELATLLTPLPGSPRPQQQWRRQDGHGEEEQERREDGERLRISDMLLSQEPTTSPAQPDVGRCTSEATRKRSRKGSTAGTDDVPRAKSPRLSDSSDGEDDEDEVFSLPSPGRFVPLRDAARRRRRSKLLESVAARENGSEDELG